MSEFHETSAQRVDDAIRNATEEGVGWGFDHRTKGTNRYHFFRPQFTQRTDSRFLQSLCDKVNLADGTPLTTLRDLPPQACKECVAMLTAPQQEFALS